MNRIDSAIKAAEGAVDTVMGAHREATVPLEILEQAYEIVTSAYHDDYDRGRIEAAAHCFHVQQQLGAAISRAKGGDHGD